MHCGFVFFPATEGQSQLTIRYPKSYFLKTRIKPQSYLIEKEEKKVLTQVLRSLLAK